MINKETGCRYARLDGSIVNGGSPRKSERWQGAWIYCLQHNDEESAHLIRMRNDPDYAERCEQEAANAFLVTSPAIKTLSECESERIESEAA